MSDDYGMALAALDRVRAENKRQDVVKKEYVRYPNSLPFGTTTIPVVEPNGLWDMFTYADGVLYWKLCKSPVDDVLEDFCSEPVPSVNVIFAMHNTFTGVDVSEQPSLSSLVVGYLDGDVDNTYAENLYLADVILEGVAA